MPPEEERASLVFSETRDADGLMHRSVHLTSDGRLRIEGHDLGQGVERSLGASEYEFERSLSAADTARLAALLEVDLDRLLPALQETFGSTYALEGYLEEQGIPSEFWNRIGD